MIRFQSSLFMKPNVAAILGMSPILSCCALGAEQATPAPAPTAAHDVKTGAAAGRPPKYPADLAQGQVRLVLMSVGQTTVFPDDAPEQPERNDQGAGVPGFTVTYLLERLGTEPYQKSVSGGVKLLAAGKELPWQDDRHSIHTKSFDYASAPAFLDFGKPKVSDPKRAIIVQYVCLCAAPAVPSYDLQITAGYDDDVQEFTFPDILARKGGRQDAE